MTERLKAFLAEKKATVAVITAIAAVPIVFLIGMGVDYGLAIDRQAELNAYADAAALEAVTPAMMVQSTTAAKTAALNTFNAQATPLPLISYDPNNDVTVTVTTSGSKRIATVNYKADYKLWFSGVLGLNTIKLGGGAT